MEKSLRLTQFCFENAPIGIFRVGNDGEILEVNEKACLSLGYSREELCNMTVFDIDPIFHSGMWPEHAKKVRKERTLSFETLHRHKSGKAFPVQIVISVMSFEGQDFEVSYIQDISERKQAEEEARRLKPL